jgi:heptosyltransferase-1
MADALRVLVVRTGAMGDVLHGMPAIAALRRAMPDAEIAWAIEPRWMPLLRADADARPRTPGMPLVDTVHAVPTREWSRSPASAATVRSILSLRRALHAGRYDVAIDLQGSIRSAVIARMSGARRVVGSATPRETPARMLYRETVSVRAEHVVQQAAEIVSAAVGQPIVPGDFPLPVAPLAEQWCDAFLSAQRGDGPVVFLAPTAGWGAKQWPADRFASLARALAERGCRVLVNAAPTGEDAVASHIVDATQGLAVRAACDLPQMISLLRRVNLALGGDTGPVHAAAALHRAVVAMFGPTDPRRTGPFGPRVEVLRHASSVTNHARIDATEAGLAGIPVEEVLAASLALLGISE